MKVEQFVMAYGAEQDRIRAIHSSRFPQKSLILVHLCAILNQMKKKVTRG